MRYEKQYSITRRGMQRLYPPFRQNPTSKRNGSCRAALKRRGVYDMIKNSSVFSGRRFPESAANQFISQKKGRPVAMPKLYFKYGAMGSSKTAQALMTKFNYEEKGYTVALMKPSVDERDGKDVVRSRIGLEGRGIVITPGMDLRRWFAEHPQFEVLIVDEAQFLSVAQIEQLKCVAIDSVPVLCFGLKTDFRTQMFEGSKRLFEIADSLTEIKSVCKCGRKAEVNARIRDGKIVREGEQIMMGGTESYIGVCYRCWKEGVI